MAQFSRRTTPSARLEGIPQMNRGLDLFLFGLAGALGGAFLMVAMGLVFWVFR